MHKSAGGFAKAGFWGNYRATSGVSGAFGSPSGLDPTTAGFEAACVVLADTDPLPVIVGPDAEVGHQASIADFSGTSSHLHSGGL